MISEESSSPVFFLNGRFEPSLLTGTINCIDKMHVLIALVLSLKALRGIGTELAAGKEKPVSWGPSWRRICQGPKCRMERVGTVRGEGKGARGKGVMKM